MSVLTQIIFDFDFIIRLCIRFQEKIVILILITGFYVYQCRILF